MCSRSQWLTAAAADDGTCRCWAGRCLLMHRRPLSHLCSVCAIVYAVGLCTAYASFLALGLAFVELGHLGLRGVVGLGCCWGVFVCFDIV